MCNAMNHSPGCRCGFGGPGHLSHWVSPQGALHTLSKRQRSYVRYVNPNAHCPVCFSPVFFLQSESGGRVFFDQLGPPWPKHPCTSQDAYTVYRDLRPTLGARRVEYSWQVDGWSPLLEISIASVSPTLFSVSGFIADDPIVLYVVKGALRSKVDLRSLRRPLCQVRRRDSESFQVSCLPSSLDSLDFVGYTSSIRAENEAIMFRMSQPVVGPAGRVRRSKT